MDPALALLLRLLAAIGVSLLLSLIVGRWLLRLNRSGAGVIGGVCAGVALGPAVLGGLAPGVYAEWMVGGVAPAMQAARIEARLPGELESLRASGVSEAATREHETQERDRAAACRLESERDRAFRRLAAGAMAASCALLAAMALARPVRVRAGPMGAGVISGVLAMLAGAVGARLAIGVAIDEAVVFGAVLAGGVISWRGSSAARSFGLGAMVPASIALGALAEAWVGVALASVWGAGVLVRMLDADSSSGRFGRAVAEGVLVPASAALVVSLAGRDISLGGAVLIAGACLVAGDLQFVASWIGMNLFESGRSRARPLTAWLVRFGRCGAGWQVLLLGLAVAGLGIDPGSAGGSALVYAVAGAAVTSEITRPGAYRAMRRYRRDLASFDGD